MRIAMFTNAYLPTISGVVTSIDLFRRGLREAGHEVHVFAPEYEGFHDTEPYIFRFPAVDLSEQLDLSLVLPVKALMESAVRGVKPVLIHSHHPLLMGDLAHAFADDLGIPLVFTFHTQYERYAQHYAPLAPKLAGLITEEVVGRYLKRCQHVIVPTESIRAMLAETFEMGEQVTVVPTPVDGERFQVGDPGALRTRYAPDGEDLLLYVGRLAKEKSVDMLLRAFAQAAVERSAMVLLLVGRGPQRQELEQLAAQLGISDRVHFVGGVPHAAVGEYYAAADLFLFASRSETQGLVLIEAMAAGLPVVAVEAPGAVDVLREGGGVLTEPNPQALAQASLSVLASGSRRNELRRHALRAVKRFSVPAATAALLGAYQAALQR